MDKHLPEAVFILSVVICMMMVLDNNNGQDILDGLIKQANHFECQGQPSTRGK